MRVNSAMTAVNQAMTSHSKVRRRFVPSYDAPGTCPLVGCSEPNPRSPP